LIKAIINNYAFQRYTQVRRLVLLECLDDQTAGDLLLHPDLSSSLLIFILTDPNIADREFVYPLKYSEKLSALYSGFIHDWAKYTEKQRVIKKEEFRSEELTYLAKDYHKCYEDTEQNLSQMANMKSEICRAILYLRE
jgi:hypothetical protein